MSTRLTWSRAGLVLSCETSQRPLPKTAWAFALPPFSDVNTVSAGIQLALVTDAQTGVTTGIRITNVELLPAGFAYRLSWTAYQGSTPNPLEWVRVNLGTLQTIDLTIPVDLASATYRFFLSRTYAGVTEDYVETSIITPGEAALAPVEGLATYRSGSQTMLRWDRSLDPRPVEYEFRMGTSAALGRILGRLPVGVTSLVTTGDGTYWVAEYYRGVYSDWRSITLQGSTQVRNVVQTWDESATGWEGVCTGGAAPDGFGGLLLGGVADFDDVLDVDEVLDVDLHDGVAPTGFYEAPPSHVVDLGALKLVQMSFVMDAEGGSNSLDVDAIPDVDEVEDVDGDSAGLSDAQPMMRRSLNGVDWEPWQPFVPGEYPAWKVTAGISLTSEDPQVYMRVGTYSWTVDMPDRHDLFTGRQVPTTGIVLPLTPAFQSVRGCQVTIHDGQPGDAWRLDAKTSEQISGHIENPIGVHVLRNNVDFDISGF